jgi:hypothetical protein
MLRRQTWDYFICTEVKVHKRASSLRIWNLLEETLFLGGHVKIGGMCSDSNILSNTWAFKESQTYFGSNGLQSPKLNADIDSKLEVFTSSKEFPCGSFFAALVTCALVNLTSCMLHTGNKACNLLPHTHNGHLRTSRCINFRMPRLDTFYW